MDCVWFGFIVFIGLRLKQNHIRVFRQVDVWVGKILKTFNSFVFVL